MCRNDNSIDHSNKSRSYYTGMIINFEITTIILHYIICTILIPHTACMYTNFEIHSSKIRFDLSLAPKMYESYDWAHPQLGRPPFCPCGTLLRSRIAISLGFKFQLYTSISSCKYSTFDAFTTTAVD